MSESGAASRGLRRLVQVRLLEEEQSRRALDTALAELHRLERGIEAAAERSRRGRQLVQDAVRSGRLADRIAGIEESRSALRQTVVLQAELGKTRQTADFLREQYQAARVDRRQVETILQEAAAAEALDASRRSQQDLDDWYGSRRPNPEAVSGRS